MQSEQGIGVGFMFLAAIVSVTQNIEDGRSFAMGAALCGGGVGSFVFNPVFHALLSMYGWRGTLMVVSGIMLNGIFLSLPSRRYEVHISTKSDNQISESGVHGQRTKTRDVIIHTQDVYDQRDMESDKNCTALFFSTDTAHSTESDKEGIALMELRDTMQDMDTGKEGAVLTSVTDKECSTEYDKESIGLITRSDIVQFKVKQNMLNNQLPGQLHTLDEHTPQQCTSKENNECGIFQIFAQAIRILLPISVFRNTHACLLIISGFIYSFSYFIPLSYLPDLVVEKGFSTSKASWAAAVMGITQTVFRVVIGRFSDFRCIDRLVLYIVCVIMSGAVTVTCFLLSSFELLMMYAVVFGIFFGGGCALLPVITGDISGPEGVGDTFGVMLTTGGFGALFGTPLAGWLFDQTGRYDLSYTVAGSVSVFSGVMLFLLKVIPSNVQLRQSVDLNVEGRRTSCSENEFAVRKQTTL